MGNVALVIGPPGCGKTTHLAGLVRQHVDATRTVWGTVPGPQGSPVLVCSLTRAAAAEAAGRVQLPRAAVGTLHAHAYRALNAPDLVCGHEHEFSADCPEWRLSTSAPAQKRKTATPPTEAEPHAEDDLGRLFGTGQQTRGDIVRTQYDLLRTRRVPRDRWPTMVGLFAESFERWKHEHELVDFGDLITSCIESEVYPATSPRHLLVDEAQDMSAAELALLRLWATQCESLTIIGDPYQAIYQWRGAHPEMFWSAKIDDAHRQVLSQSYRVPRAVHGLAMRWVSKLSDFHPIEYHPRDADGDISTVPARWSQPESLLPLIESELADGRSVMIQATTAYMIAPMVNVMRKAGIPFSNPWRAHRGDWNPLRSRGTTMADRLSALLCDQGRLWTGVEVARFVAPLAVAGNLQRGAKSSPLLDEERPLTFDELATLFTPDALSALWHVFDGEHTTAAEYWLGAMPADRRRVAEYPVQIHRRGGAAALTTEPKVYVGTIHSFKGAEADTVILFPDLSPAGVRQWMSGGEHRDECIRAGYVAITRARQRFMLATPAGDAMPMRRFLHA